MVERTLFFTEGRHSDRSAVGLTGSYETLQIDQAEVRTKCANSILVRYDLRQPPHKNGVGTLCPDLRLVESASPYPTMN